MQSNLVIDLYYVMYCIIISPFANLETDDLEWPFISINQTTTKYIGDALFLCVAVAAPFVYSFYAPDTLQYTLVICI